MFKRPASGLTDFVAAALCAWAAVYHTPVGALARDGWAWATKSRSGARPLLAYYSGGIYDLTPAPIAGLPSPPPHRPAGPPAATTAEALGMGTFATWSQLPEAHRRHARDLASRFKVDPGRLGNPSDGPRAFAELVASAARQLGSEEAAVVAVFCGWEPARYAADRARAAGETPDLEALVRALPPGLADPLSAASRALTLGTAWALAWPLELEARVTSPFGWRDHPMNGRRQLHTGVDLGVPVGTQVRATAAGLVRRASEDAVNGRVLVLDHGRGVTTAYCHNDALEVFSGQRVRVGEPIARSGNTGRSTGPHLHYQVELGHRPVDPLGLRAGAAPSTGASAPSPAGR